MQLNNPFSKASVFLLAAVSVFAQNAYLRTTTDANRWVDAGSVSSAAWASTGNYIEIFPSTEYQTVMGWGGTVQEKHWEGMKVLSAAGKDSIMRELFDTSGCNISFLRCPIGCCDFDLNEAPISLNETKDDYEMKNFSLHRDSTRKIPLIKMAQAINPHIRFWGCPWSPPRWMHDDGNFDRGNMKSDAKTQAAYALYLEKFVLGYKDAGINVEWVCCQNEPNIVDGGYPKCGWTNALELSFYKNYMIPRFKQSNLSTRIFLGVFCCGNYADWITYFMSDKTVADFISITSHSYQNPDWALKSFNDYPTIPFFQSEAPFGPGPPGDNVQDWGRGRDEFNNVADFMNNRTAVYTMWNMVNDQTGKSGFGWAQNVMIQVNSSTKKVTYNPHFYAYKHFAYYVKAGAKAVRCAATGTGLAKMCAFKNPNGDIILVGSNTGASAYALTVKVNDQMWKGSFPANSFGTMKIAIGTVAAKKQESVVKVKPTLLSNVQICNSVLSFSLASSAEVQNVDVSLRDLRGRTVWAGARTGSELVNGRQVFGMQSAQGGIIPGTYLLTVRIRNSNGTVRTVENNVTAIN